MSSRTNRLLDAAIDRPRRTIVLVLALVGLALPGLLRLELRTDGHAMIPPRDEAIRFDAAVRDHFDLRDPVAVHYQPQGGELFDPSTLDQLVELSDALAAIEGVGPEHLTSLATEASDRVFPGTLDFRALLDPLPATPADLERLRGDLDAIRLLDGTLVGLDRRSALLVVGVPNLSPERAAHSAERIDLYREILEVVKPFRATSAARSDSAAPPAEISVVGAPVAEFLLGLHVLEDLALLLPLALTVIALVLFAGCRRAWGVMLGLSEVGACLLFVFGVMGWLGIPVYLTTAVLPVILTTLGLADEIHIVWHYQHLLGTARSTNSLTESRAVVRRTLREMARPITLTSITTSLGFLSFTTSPIEPVRVFGVFAAVGIAFCLLWSFTVVPAALALLPAERLRRPQRAILAPRQREFAAWLRRHRAPVLTALALVTLGLGAGTPRLVVQDSWLDGFAAGSAFRLATERVDAQYFGTHQLLVHLDLAAGLAPDELPADIDMPRVGRMGPMLSPSLLRAVDDFEKTLRQRADVGGVLGPASHLRTVKYLWLARRDGDRSLPSHAFDIQMVIDHFDNARGEHLRRRVVDDSLERAVVTLFLRDANYQQAARVIGAVRAAAREHLAPHGVEIGFAGDVAVSQAMIPAIVETQVQSLLLALASALLAVCWLKRSLLYGLAAVAPAIVAVLWVFGLMGWLGIPLGVATSMFCAITLGIGIDYGIHFTDRIERAHAAGITAPIARALGEAGPAIVADTAAVALGFGLLVVSQVPANARLGLLVAAALTAACILTLVGLGAALAGIGPRPDPPPP
ncbi:MAG: MMPL family transporter [Acidobacteriota bacterium]